MIEIFREIKDTPTPSLLVAGGMIFLVLAVGPAHMTVALPQVA